MKINMYIYITDYRQFDSDICGRWWWGCVCHCFTSSIFITGMNTIFKTILQYDEKKITKYVENKLIMMKKKMVVVVDFHRVMKLLMMKLI